MVVSPDKQLTHIEAPATLEKVFKGHRVQTDDLVTEEDPFAQFRHVFRLANPVAALYLPAGQLLHTAELVESA